MARISVKLVAPPTIARVKPKGELHLVSDAAVQTRGGKALPLRILIADDDRDTANTLALVLRDEGHEVHTALRGDEVVDACRLLRPEVVIMDINMPGMSGYAVARELRERHGPLAPLLIAISGIWTQSADAALGKAVGFDHFLMKPCEPRLVLRLLESLRAASGAAGTSGA
jgi:DNA-binding response OmpR family regulator